MSLARLLLLPLLLLLAALPAAAAPVRLEPPVATARFRLFATPAARGAVPAVGAELEQARSQLGTLLGRDWPGVVDVRLGSGRAEFDALTPDGATPPGWAVALAYPDQQLVLLDVRLLTQPDGPATLRHELVHVALGQLGPAWPRWFHEGLAMNLAGERVALGPYAALHRALRTERLLRFEHLSERWPTLPGDVEIAYAQSADFVAHLVDRYGPQGMRALVDGVARGEPFETAFGKAFHTSLYVEEEDWRATLPVRFGWLPGTTLGSLLWLTATLLCVAAFVRRRYQRARKLDELDLQEAAEAEAEAAEARLHEAEAAHLLAASAAEASAAAAATPEDALAPAPTDADAEAAAEPGPETASPRRPTLH